ncbi:MAG TPA: hypothetical protein VMD91_13455 [Candidatus Sulfotelmatobacter sp.]|nr:hypothetical protein [Candidatus Sulfotelmatobacter sp.]
MNTVTPSVENARRERASGRSSGDARERRAIATILAYVGYRRPDDEYRVASHPKPE